MIYAREWRQKLCEETKLPNGEVSKILGCLWRTLSDAERKPYYMQADLERQKHRKDNPGYKYQPQRKKSPNVIKTLRKKINPVDQLSNLWNPGYAFESLFAV